jgi:hypothetical protein
LTSQLSKLFNFDQEQNQLKPPWGSKLNGSDSKGAKVKQRQQLRGPK